MNSLSFDVEVLNGNTDYIYRFKHNTDDTTKSMINDFVHRMIINNSIKCFVSYAYEINDDIRKLRYSIAPQTTLSDYFKNRFTDISACISVILNILKVIKTAEEYMIDRRFILFDPDYMFINKSDKSISVMCIPVRDAKESSLTEFMRSIIMPLNFEGIPNSDTLKVTVYQYAFDKEPIESTIEFFSDFCSKLSAKNTESKPVKNESDFVPESPQPVSQPKVLPFAKKSDGVAKSHETKSMPIPTVLPTPPKNDNAQSKGKEKKSGLFSSLFDSSSKKNKEKPSQNAFGVNIPGKTASPLSDEKIEKVSAFSGINLPEVKKEQNAPVSLSTPKQTTMKIEDEEETVFETQDEGTVFLNNGAERAFLRDNTGAIFEITGNIFSIGRSGKSGVKIDLELSQKTVSHLHATIYNECGCYFISDNGSANGTFVNNRRLKPNEKVPIEHGSRVRISNIDFTFEIM